MATIGSKADLTRRIAGAKREGKSRVSDGAGLYCIPVKGGDAWAWRFDFTAPNGKRKTLSLGLVEEVSLATARERRNEARAKLDDGIDPSTERKEKRAQAARAELTVKRAARGQALPGSLREVFEDWHKTRSPGWSESYATKVKARIVNDVLPWLGDRPVGEITEAELLSCLKRIQDRGAIESAHSTCQNLGQVFRFAIVVGLATRNPASGMAEALVPVVVRHQAATIEPEAFAQLVALLSAYHGSPQTRVALLCAASLFQRPGNIRQMEWAHLDLERGEWSIPSAEMKRSKQKKASGRPHLVPLAPEVVEMLQELRPLTGRGRYVFASDYASDRPMSENTLNVALRRLGIGKDQQVSHGFRASARSILVEHLGYPEAVVEAQLAHEKSGPLGAAYDRAEFLAQRREMMSRWGAMVARMAQGESFADAAKATDAGKKPQLALIDGANMEAMAAVFERIAGRKVSAREIASAARSLRQGRAKPAAKRRAAA